ncbi:uncharacterized protein LOC129795672 [Lutzomyia longipalpis]|uniref:uncharacterized protein LOC129795672 n=1 Tax=Lutzomyia longipalpis TaxID=7200 RepID=UPI0024843DF7|nr:uncharacterized protein LOC129795672 [Lutzomyia longipalpis]XP_055693113.1 uncharacterized protein LOC129795672 [Lutzomyia longipalpis]
MSSMEGKDKNRIVYGDNPDVTFFFPDNGGAQLLVEKRKLAQSSVVFQKQFSEGFESSDRIAIKDISFDTFNVAMKEIYGSSIEIRESNYQELLYVASKYFIYTLIEKIIQFALTFISAKNLTEHFEAIERYEIKRLNDHIEDICVRHPLEIIEKLDCTKAHMNLLKIILQSSNLTCSEYDLYVAVVNMMKEASKDALDVATEMRKKLGNLINFIRFPVMSIDELILCAKPPSLLTKEQALDLLLWVKCGIYSESVQFFSTNSRSIPNFDRCPHCNDRYAYCLSCSKYR